MRKIRNVSVVLGIVLAFTGVAHGKGQGGHGVGNGGSGVALSFKQYASQGLRYLKTLPEGVRRKHLRDVTLETLESDLNQVEVRAVERFTAPPSDASYSAVNYPASESFPFGLIEVKVGVWESDLKKADVAVHELASLRGLDLKYELTKEMRGFSVDATRVFLLQLNQEVVRLFEGVEGIRDTHVISGLLKESGFPIVQIAEDGAGWVYFDLSSVSVYDFKDSLKAVLSGLIRALGYPYQKAIHEQYTRAVIKRLADRLNPAHPDIWEEWDCRILGLYSCRVHSLGEIFPSLK